MPCVMVGESVANIFVGEEHLQRRRKTASPVGCGENATDLRRKHALPVSLWDRQHFKLHPYALLHTANRTGLYIHPNGTGQIDLPW